MFKEWDTIVEIDSGHGYGLEAGCWMEARSRIGITFFAKRCGSKSKNLDAKLISSK